MAANSKHQLPKPTIYAFLLGVLMINLSALPGIESQVPEFSTDLLSRQFITCDINGQLVRTDKADCALEKNKVAGRITVSKVTRDQAEATEATAGASTLAAEYYEIVSEIECDLCGDGIRRVTRTVTDLKDVTRVALELFADQTKEAATQKSEEKERLRKLELCLIDEEGEPITKESKILQCRIEKLDGMDEEAADEYYSENLKERLQDLLQSKNANDRAIAMSALARLGENLDINCATRPGLQGDARNPMLNHRLLNPQMNPMRPISIAGQNTSDEGERSFIKESSCDMWAFGTYNNNVEYLKLAAAQPNANKPAIQNALTNLRTGWGAYFSERGLQAQGDLLGMFGMGDQIAFDLNENQTSLNESLKAIVDQHKDWLEGSNVSANGAAAGQVVGREARGAVVPAQAGTVNGTVSTGTDPWPSSRMKSTASPVPFNGAPRLGAPVGR